ncbi:hypothetical protein MMYC01_202799 [Madurella mycetomatis]|uniref:Uncharacterized protein n=1 Tax=Madurella mycetomatis TaxID=100816 RepID=A0A175WD38_9PEZI|nr:hypothetical protein MMYC01_202799 [Madurella mycetomatis]
MLLGQDAAQGQSGVEEAKDDNFFLAQTQTNPVSFVLKPSVIQQIRKLRENSNSSDFANDLLDLIEHGMLVTNVEDRFSSEDCCRVLNFMNTKFEKYPGKATVTYVFKGGSQDTRCVELGCLEGLELVPTEERYSGILLSAFEKSRAWMEDRLESRVDWWPLQPVSPELLPNHEKLRWTVSNLYWLTLRSKVNSTQYGGKEMSITLDEDGASQWKNQIINGSNSILPSWQTPGPKTASTAGDSAIGTIKKRLESVLNRLLRIPIPWLGKTNARASNQTQISNPPGVSPPACWRESYLCVDRCWTSAVETKLSTIDSIDTLADDYAFFIEALTVLSCAQGNWLQRFFSWKSFAHVNLSKFHFLFNNSDRIKSFDWRTLENQPDILCQGYEYTCLCTEIRIHMQIMAQIILEGIRNPELGRGNRTVLSGIPKLKTPPGLEKKALISGWGFHAGQGPCVVKIFGWLSTILAFGLAFIPIWLASIDKMDLQNAFAPVSFLVHPANFNTHVITRPDMI